MGPRKPGPDVTRFIQYPSQQEAFSFLEDILADQKALGLLHGPEAAGKSELIDQIAGKVGERAAVAVVDGSRLKPTEFLTAVLTEFGYELELNSVDELINMLNVFAVQQARTREVPVLILEHFNHMYPSTLNVLCQLALLTVGKRFALRIILVGDRYFKRVIDSPRMLPVAIRLAGAFEMRPLSARESAVYLCARLNDAGIGNADSIFPVEVCESLHAASGGWPGTLWPVTAAQRRQRRLGRRSIACTGRGWHRRRCGPSPLRQIQRRAGCGSDTRWRGPDWRLLRLLP